MRPGKSYKLHTNSPGHSFQNACFTWHERPVLRPHSGCLLQLLLYLRLRYCRFFIWSENPSKFSIWLSRRCNVARCSIRLIPMTSLMVLAPWQMRWSFVLHFNTLRLRQNGFNSKIGLRDCSQQWPSGCHSLLYKIKKFMNISSQSNSSYSDKNLVQDTSNTIYNAIW